MTNSNLFRVHVLSLPKSDARKETLIKVEPSPIKTCMVSFLKNMNAVVTEEDEVLAVTEKWKRVLLPKVNLTRINVVSV